MQGKRWRTIDYKKALPKVILPVIVLIFSIIPLIQILAKAVVELVLAYRT